MIAKQSIRPCEPSPTCTAIPRSPTRAYEARRGNLAQLRRRSRRQYNATPRAGLYHFGLKVGETDEELIEAIQRVQEHGVTIVGASDHTVTHSLYIEDPDGNEIELYIDVQPAIWHDEPMAVLSPTKPLRL